MVKGSISQIIVLEIEMTLFKNTHFKDMNMKYCKSCLNFYLINNDSYFYAFLNCGRLHMNTFFC